MSDPFRILTGMVLLIFKFCAFALVLHVAPIERSAYRTECPDYYKGINHVWK
jgi:hypothetical protein